MYGARHTGCIQAQYEPLTTLAQSFGKHAQATTALATRVRRGGQALQASWQGQGSQAFQHELATNLLPGLDRLAAALRAAQATTGQIQQLLQQAEADAAAPFRGAPASGQEGGGFWGAVGDFFKGAGAELKDMVTGLWNMVTDPSGTAKGLWYGITHPSELWDAIKQPYVEAWESGHPWEAIGRGTVAVVTTLLGMKGADKVAKMLKGGQAAGKAGKIGTLVNRLSAAAHLSEVATVADDVGRLNRAVQSTAQILARDARLAESLLPGATAADATLALDGFKAATRGLTSPQAAATIERFAKVTDAVIPDIMKQYGGALGRVGDIPAELVGRRITALGRGSDTKLAAEAGERILKVPDVPAPLRIPGGPTTTWTPELNALWLREAIERGDVIKLITEVTPTKGSLLGAKEFNGVSAYSRELNELLAAGYRRVGDYLIPPQ